ncbi:MAG: hypothetical protein IPJ03_17060 [Ignavibacteriales bacterium]|nr:hypothetical protein [Ignavibacteriales bacterium]
MKLEDFEKLFFKNDENEDNVFYYTFSTPNYLYDSLTEAQQQVSVEPEVKVNLADIKKEFEELFGEKNFAGRIFIKRNTEAQKIWDWFKEKLKAITTL